MHAAPHLQGFETTGVERSLLLAARAPEGLVKVGDAHNIPVGDATQDFVICYSLLEHVLDPEQVLREIRRVMAPGGVCILHTTRAHWRTGEINFPLFQWMPPYLRAVVWHMSGRTHISPHLFTYDGLRRLAEQVGFDVTSPFDATAPEHAGLKGMLVRRIFAFYDSRFGRAWLHFKAAVVELHLRAPAA